MDAGQGTVGGEQVDGIVEGIQGLQSLVHIFLLGVVHRLVRHGLKRCQIRPGVFHLGEGDDRVAGLLRLVGEQPLQKAQGIGPGWGGPNQQRQGQQQGEKTS